jgi:DNA-binding NarL/FixJ family response regulator
MMNTWQAFETHHHVSVLLVDDSPDTLLMLTESLEAAGITILVALDGQRALNLLERISPSLILMDALMPGMDGFETCQRIKQRTDCVDIPVIFMTGLTDTDHVVRGLAAGGVDYVTKPVVMEELIARMRVHLSNARMATGARAALDASGRYLLAVDAKGCLLWRTPQAASLLADCELPTTTDIPRLPQALIAGLGLGRPYGAGQADFIWPTSTGTFVFTRLAQSEPDEYLLSITRRQNCADEQILLQQGLSLTSRQAEVLLWVCRGKSNREIGMILAASPRTVNKHLEQIFAKLQVDNRTSAAVMGLKALGKS